MNLIDVATSGSAALLLFLRRFHLRRISNSSNSTTHFTRSKLSTFKYSSSAGSSIPCEKNILQNDYEFLFAKHSSNSIFNLRTLSSALSQRSLLRPSMYRRAGVSRHYVLACYVSADTFDSGITISIFLRECRDHRSQYRHSPSIPGVRQQPHPHLIATPRPLGGEVCLYGTSVS